MTALSRQARETIKDAKWHEPRVTIVGYVRQSYPDGVWGGDSCGCTDDRCIGYHHDADEECHCLPVLLDVYIVSLSATDRVTL